MDILFGLWIACIITFVICFIGWAMTIKKDLFKAYKWLFGVNLSALAICVLGLLMV